MGKIVGDFREREKSTWMSDLERGKNQERKKVEKRVIDNRKAEWHL